MFVAHQCADVLDRRQVAETAREDQLRPVVRQHVVGVLAVGLVQLGLRVGEGGLELMTARVVKRPARYRVGPPRGDPPRDAANGWPTFGLVDTELSPKLSVRVINHLIGLVADEHNEYLQPIR